MQNKVSIIIPYYNKGEFIVETLNSVYNQTYNNFEIILINDGSDDIKSIEILETLANSRLKIFSIKNSGVSFARNYGVSKASGKYILPLDADDLIDPTYIEKCVLLLDQNVNLRVVYSQTEKFGAINEIWTQDDFSFSGMLLCNLVVVSAMYRKTDWELVGGYKLNMKYGLEDWDFWLSFVERRLQFFKIEEPLFKYRILDASRSSLAREKTVALNVRMKLNHLSLYYNGFYGILKFIYHLYYYYIRTLIFSRW